MNQGNLSLRRHLDKELKIVVGIPWASPFIFTKVLDSMLELKTPAGYELEYVRGSGWCSARRHNQLLERAVQKKADLICILGADQLHPADTIERLVKRIEEGCDVITALVPARNMVPGQNMKAYQPLAWRTKKKEPGRMYSHPPKRDEHFEIVHPAEGDLQEIDVIGTGVTMFKREHLDKLKKPWLEEKIENKDGFTCSNDTDSRFILRFRRELQLKVWLDTTIKIKHLHIFEIDDTFQERFSDAGVSQAKQHIPISEVR